MGRLLEVGRLERNHKTGGSNCARDLQQHRPPLPAPSTLAQKDTRNPLAVCGCMNRPLFLLFPHPTRNTRARVHTPTFKMEFVIFRGLDSKRTGLFASSSKTGHRIPN